MGLISPLGPSLDGKEPTAFKAVGLSSALGGSQQSGKPRPCEKSEKKARWKKLYSDLSVPQSANKQFDPKSVVALRVSAAEIFPEKSESDYCGVNRVIVLFSML